VFLESHENCETGSLFAPEWKHQQTSKCTVQAYTVISSVHVPDNELILLPFSLSLLRHLEFSGVELRLKLQILNHLLSSLDGGSTIASSVPLKHRVTAR
jgi:hypothetical protein